MKFELCSTALQSEYARVMAQSERPHRSSLLASDVITCSIPFITEFNTFFFWTRIYYANEELCNFFIFLFTMFIMQL